MISDKSWTARWAGFHFLNNNMNHCDGWTVNSEEQKPVTLSVEIRTYSFVARNWVHLLHNVNFSHNAMTIKLLMVRRTYKKIDIKLGQYLAALLTLKDLLDSNVEVIDLRKLSQCLFHANCTVPRTRVEIMKIRNGEENLTMGQKNIAIIFARYITVHKSPFKLQAGHTAVGPVGICWARNAFSTGSHCMVLLIFCVFIENRRIVNPIQLLISFIKREERDPGASVPWCYSIASLVTYGASIPDCVYLI